MYPILDGGISGTSPYCRRDEPLIPGVEMAADMCGKILWRNTPERRGAGDCAEPGWQQSGISNEMGLYRQDTSYERQIRDSGREADLQRGLAEAPLHRSCLLVLRMGAQTGQRR